MALKTTPDDSADYLDSPEAMAAYIDTVFEDGDPALLTLCSRNVVARARGMTQVAREAGLSRESLYPGTRRRRKSGVRDRRPCAQGAWPPTDSRCRRDDP